MSRFRVLTLLFAMLAIAATLAACGGGDDSETTSSGGSSGASSEDPQQVLDATFDSGATIESADLDVSLDVQVSGDEGGDLALALSGPVDGGGDAFPKFDLTASVDGSFGGESQSFEGGAISTGDAGYITYNGDTYEVDAQTFSLLTDSYEQAGAQGQQPAGDLSAFADVLENVENEGTEDVEGTETVHISGDVNTQKLIDAIRPLTEQAEQLGTLSGGQIPTAEELDQVEQLVSGATFDVYSGAEDDILRKLDGTIELDDPESDETASIELSITLGGVNEPQEVSAPSDAKPLSDLTGGIDIGSLLGTGAGSPGASAGGPAATPGLSPSQTDCLATATTPEAIQACLTQ